MSGLLYYIPNATRAIKVEGLAELGLAHAFEGRLTPREVSRGPDGDRGVVVADPDRLSEHLLGYWPERQTWRKLPGSTVWLGSTNAERVEPRDLVRENAVAGHWVTLADGQDWLVPVARGLADEEDSLSWYSALPSAVTLDDEGNWTRGGVVAKYQQLWQIACDWWDAVQAAPVEEVEDNANQGTARVRVRFSFDNVCDAALVALGTNYRLARAEVAFLGLFDDACAREVLMAVVDWPVAKEFLKKKLAAHAGSSTGDGPPAGTAATGQPSPTSPP